MFRTRRQVALLKVVSKFPIVTYVAETLDAI